MGSRPRLHGGRLSAGGRGWVPASARTTGGGGFPLPSSRGQALLRGDGDGSPHPRGQREGDGFPLPSSRGQALPAEGRGWVPASARTTGGGGFPLPSSRGQALCGGTGMGPRIREDNGWGWIPASVFTGGRLCCGGDGDGSPHPRGQWEGVDSRFRRHGDRLSAGRTGMGPRIREDNGWGWIPASVFTGTGSPAGGRGWVPALVFTGTGFLRDMTGGGGKVPELPVTRKDGRLPGVGRGWVPASARTTGGRWIPASVRGLCAGITGGREDDTSGSARLKDGFLHPPSARGQALLRENGLGSGSCSG